MYVWDSDCNHRVIWEEAHNQCNFSLPPMHPTDLPGSTYITDAHYSWAINDVLVSTTSFDPLKVFLLSLAARIPKADKTAHCAEQLSRNRHESPPVTGPFTRRLLHTLTQTPQSDSCKWMCSPCEGPGCGYGQRSVGS